MFWLYLIFSALISRAEYDRVATAQNAQLPRLTDAKGLSTKAEDGQMTTLLDVLTIYRSVISLSPTDKALLACCDSVTVTPHLDLVVIFTHHVNAWVKYASSSLFNLVVDSSVLPCLPEAKPSGDIVLGGGARDGHPPPPDLPPHPSKPPDSLPSRPKKRHRQTSLTSFDPPSPADDDTCPRDASDGSQQPPPDLPPHPSKPPHPLPSRPTDRPPYTSVTPFRPPPSAGHKPVAGRRAGGKPPPPPDLPPFPTKPPHPLFSQPKKRQSQTSLATLSPPSSADEKCPSSHQPTGERTIRKRGEGYRRLLRYKRMRRRTSKRSKAEEKKEKRGKEKEEEKGQGKRMKSESPLWKTDILAMGAVTSEDSEGASPALWVVVGTVLGLGMAVVWNVLQHNNEVRFQNTGDLVQDITRAITNLFQVRERPFSNLDRHDHPDDRRVIFEDPGLNRNESLARRMRRVRRRNRRKERRRRRRRHHHDSSTPTSSQTITGGNNAMASWEFFSTNATRMLRPDDRTGKETAPTNRVACMKKLRRKIKHDRRKRKLRRKRKGHRERRKGSDSPMDWESESSQTTEATSESTATTYTASGGSGGQMVDNVQPDRITWDDSDEYSEAHSVSRMRSTSHSTCSSSLREEFIGPWVSTSLSFIVYDLDVIDDIPDEVLEVLSCDQKPCEFHPHDRYHYVGSKIIVQRLPLPVDTSERNPCNNYLPCLHLSSFNTVITTSGPADAGWKETAPKKQVRIVEDIDNEQKGPQIENIDLNPSHSNRNKDPNLPDSNVGRNSYPLPPVINVVNMEVNTEQVDTAEVSSQTSNVEHCVSICINTEQVETIESSQQTSYMDSLVSSACNTEILDVTDSSAQTSFEEYLVSVAVNTECVNMKDFAQQCDRTAENLTETGMNTEPLVSDPRCNLISSASMTDRIQVTDFCNQASLEPEKLMTDSCSQTISEHSMPQPVVETRGQHDASTQTPVIEQIQLPSVSHQMPFPLAVKATRFCAPAAKAASAGFHGSDVKDAMAYVKEAYEECLKNPSGETYYPKHSPSPENIFRTSPVRSRGMTILDSNQHFTPSSPSKDNKKKESSEVRSTWTNILDCNQCFMTSPPFKDKKKKGTYVLDSNQHFMTSPPSKDNKKESSQKTEEIQSPTGSMPKSLSSVGNPVTLASSTIKGVYDQCLKGASCQQLKSSLDMFDYPQSARENISMPSLNKHEQSKLETMEKRKQIYRTDENIGSLIAVSHNLDPWAKQLRESGQASGKNTKDTMTIRVSNKPKQGVSSTGRTTDRTKVVARSSVKRTASKSHTVEGAGKPTISKSHGIQRQNEVKSIEQHKTVCPDKTSLTQTCHQSGSTEVTRNMTHENISSDNNVIEKSAFNTEQTEGTSAMSDLFRELKEKVAKWQSSQEETIIAPSEPVPVSESKSTTIETTALQTAQEIPTAATQGQLGTEYHKPCEASTVERSHTVVSSPETEYVSTQNICNLQQSKKGVRSPQSVLTTSGEKMDRDTSERKNNKASTVSAQKASDVIHEEKEAKTDNKLSKQEIPEVCPVPSPPQDDETGLSSAPCAIPQAESTKTQERSDTQEEQQAYISSHAKEEKQVDPKVCITVQDKEDAGHVHTVCIVSQPKTERQSPKKGMSPQKVPVLSPQKICITTRRAGDSQSPQKVCIISHQKEDRGAVQKVSIIPCQTPGLQSPPKVCIIPKQKNVFQSPATETTSLTEKEKLGSPQKVIMSAIQECSVASDLQESMQETAWGKPQKPDSSLQSNEIQDQKGETGTQSPLEFFKQVCPPCVLQAYADSVAIAKDKHVKIDSEPYDTFGRTGKLSKNRAWGNVEQILERQRSKLVSHDNAYRSAVLDENQPVSVTSVAKEIKEMYDRCMTGKVKPKKFHQTKSKNTVSLTNRPCYEQFDELASFATLQGTTFDKGEAADSDSKQTNSVGQLDKKQVSFSKLENDIQKQAGDSGPLSVLPLTFAFGSKPPGPETPSPSDQDSSNSAERASSKTQHKNHTHLSSPHTEKKKPYESLSRVNIKDASPPYQVSDRAKNNVFSPVGWTSPRSGITSLFRAQSSEKMDQIGRDIDQSTNPQTYTFKEESLKKQANIPSTEERASKRSTVKSAISVTQQNVCQQNEQSVNTLVSKSSVSAGLRSSVKHDASACGQTEVSKDKHYCSLHPDMVEMAKARPHVTEPRFTNIKQCGSISSDHRPRIVSRYRLQKQRGSVPKHLGVSINKLPSKPPSSQSLANQLVEKQSAEEMNKRGRKLADTNGVMEGTEQHRDNEAHDTRPGSEADKTTDVSDSSLYPLDKETEEFQGRNVIMPDHSLDMTLTRTISSKYRLCQYTNDINEELKGKLNITLRPSEIKRGKRKADSHTAVECENVRTTISTKCINETKALLPSKSKFSKQAHAIQTSTKVSKIPILKSLRNGSIFQRFSEANIVPKTKYGGLSCDEMKAVPKNAQLLKNSDPCYSENQVAASGPDSNKCSQGSKPAPGDLPQRKRTYSRLPVPTVSSRKCYLSEMPDKTEAKPISSSIAERIKLLQTSVLERQTANPRNTRRIGKLTRCLEKDEGDSNYNKMDVDKDDREHAQTVELMDSVPINKQTTMVTENVQEHTSQLRKRKSHTSTGTEGNISQNHNWMDLSLESLSSCESMDEDLSLSLCTLDSSTTDPSVIEVTNYAEENPTEIFSNAYVDGPVLMSQLTKELKDIAKAYEGELYPSQIRQCVLASRAPKKLLGTLWASSACSETVNNNTDQNSRTEDGGHFNVLIEKDIFAGRYAQLPHKSLSTSNCDTIKQIRITKKCLSCHDQPKHSRGSRNKRAQNTRCVSDRHSGLYGDLLEEPISRSLANANSAEGATVIGLPQASSSFVDDSDIMSILDSSTVQCSEAAPKFNNEDQAICSVNPKLLGTDRVGDSEGHQVAMHSLAATRLTLAEAYNDIEVSLVSEMPIAGSTDVMSKLWKPVSKKHNSLADATARSPDCHRRQSEMLHLTDVGRQLHLYGCSEGESAWILKTKTTRISAKGDNLSILNSDASSSL